MKSRGRIVAIIAAILLVSIPFALYFLLREPNVEISSNSISLDGMYGCHIPMEAIEDVQLINNMPLQISTNDGFEILGVSRGKFIYEKWSNVHLMLQTPRFPYILIKTRDGKHLIFNSSQSKKTTHYYHRIRDQYNRSAV